MTDPTGSPPGEPEPDADDLPLRGTAAEPFDLASAKTMRGTGWEGDLEEMRAGRVDAGEST